MATPDSGGGEFISSLMDTRLYSLGALFSDEHPDLVDEVILQAQAMEDAGLMAYAAAEGIAAEECFQTLITGLALRYYRAVSG